MRAILSCMALAGLVFAACYDTQEELDDFVERTETLRIVPSAVSCEAPFDVSGRYVFGVATSLDKTKPLRFDATFAVDTDASPWTLTITATAMAVADGTLVGDVVTASGPIGMNGAFTIDFGTITVPAEANPIAPATVKATLVLEGCTRSEELACGIVEGDIITIHASLEGSTWGIVPVPDGGDPAALTIVKECGD